jgi:hypothetical protein
VLHLYLYAITITLYFLYWEVIGMVASRASATKVSLSHQVKSGSHQRITAVALLQWVVSLAALPQDYPYDYKNHNRTKTATT